MSKKCELLLPAGGPSQFIAAVENGADAVYIGGPLFNARIGAGNFSTEEMEKAVDYAHLRNVKVYVTMNTLMEEKDLDAAVGFAEMAYEMGVDALIIQDLGLGRAIKQRMPDFPLHLSTQATVYNRQGLEAAALLGYERVVLARELSLAEIAVCSRPEIVETEVFVHGAMCICYSGQCQMSRVIGGRSGNKGRCAQPCRLPYVYRDAQGRKIRTGERENRGREEYPLSPKDLCMIDRLGELIEAGVSSLKVEGRMKSPEYVATVARIYRKYIDKYYADGSYEVSKEDMDDLMQIFNRGGFTEGYACGEPGPAFMSGLLPKNQGLKVGSVAAAVKGGMLADIELEGPLEMGDVVEIHSRDVFSMKVTYFEKREGNRVRIGDLKDKVFPGDEVYRVVSESLMKKAGETFRQTDFEGGRFRRRSVVDFTFRADEGSPLMLSAVCTGPDGEKTKVSRRLEGFVAQAAVNRAVTEEEIITQLKKTGNTPFEADRIKVMLGGPVYIPVSKINEIRREVLEELSLTKVRQYKRSADYAEPAGQPESCGRKGEAGQQFAELFFYTVESFEKAYGEGLQEKLRDAGVSDVSTRILLPLSGLKDLAWDRLDFLKKLPLQIVPYISNLTKGPCDLWLENNMEDAARLVKDMGGLLYAGNIGWIRPFAQSGIRVMGDYGLNISNSECAKAYESLGMEGWTASLETLEPADEYSGAFPLMVTQHPMDEGILTDRKGAQYRVFYDGFAEKTIITKKTGCADFESLAATLKNSTGNVRIYLT